MANPKPSLPDKNIFTENMNIVMKFITKRTIWRICHVELVVKSIFVCNNIVDHQEKDLPSSGLKHRRLKTMPNLIPINIVVENNLWWMKTGSKS